MPRLAPGVTLLRLSADYRSVIDCLKSRQSPWDVPQLAVVVADRRMSDGSVEVIQLRPLSAVLIELCDGTRTAAELAGLFPELEDGLDKFPPAQACLFALNEFARQGLIAHSPA